ncbi:MAG: sodium/proton-translocating pyrophosphatase [Brachybacterium sp.]|uniref:sodium/proton-translocating pyrophosphatase n=1 Tax=Brachybacterium sp. TaxID=1891286 RepID=UPI002648D5A4|nr:sodium/proton-translocating pyrophosphatase [Brachybacterium sp.]MDN5685971.1 sodium/proton-translocating pyrophosphatase [Brachybacterium sp.]
MDLITQFPLGDDIAVTLLVLGLLSVAALVAGAVVPSRLQRDEDAAEVDDDLGRRLGRQLSAAGSIILWVGLPAVVLLYLVPGSTDDRILRSAMMVVGLALGPFAAWRGLAVQLASLGLDPERRPALISRLGALATTGALAVAILPVVIVVWFLQAAGSSALMALAGGAAISALALRATAAPLDTAAASSAILVGADEHEIDTDDPTNLGAAPLRGARMFRRGAAGSADLVALTTAAAAVGVLLGVPVLAAEGILVVLLALGVALLAGGVVALVPHRGQPGHERGALRLGGVIPALLGGAGMVAAAALWLPSAYKDLRFSQVGMENFTDQAITGPQPLPREQLEPQIAQAGSDLGTLVSQTDDSRGASALLDMVTLYTISPSVAAASALGLGVVVALAAILLLDGTGNRIGSVVLRTARTSRTGGALGTTAGLGSTALLAAGALTLLLIVAGVLSVLSAGVPGMALALLSCTGLGALVVAVAHAGSLMAPTLVDRPEAERSLRDAAAGASTGPRAALLLAATLTALAALGPIATALQVAPRAATVWEDRALHGLSPTSLPLVGGIGLGVVAVLLVTASLLDGARRLGASAVVEARAAMLEKRAAVNLEDLPDMVRRAVLPAVVIVVLMPIVAGFGLGPAALPGLVIGAALTALALGLWSLGAGATLENAAAIIGHGRYGGPGSWGHSGALGGAVLTGTLRSAIGSVALPLLLTSSLLSALGVSAMVAMSTDGTSVYLRWGIAVVALVIALTCWVIASTAAEVDLEDEIGEISRPLFSRAEEETSDGLDAMDWEVEEEDGEQVSAAATKPASSGARAKRRGNRKGGGRGSR